MSEPLNRQCSHGLEINTDLSFADGLFGYGLQSTTSSAKPSVLPCNNIKGPCEPLPSYRSAGSNPRASYHDINNNAAATEGVYQSNLSVVDVQDLQMAHHVTDPNDIIDELFTDTFHSCEHPKHDVTFGSDSDEDFQLSSSKNGNSEALGPTPNQPQCPKGELLDADIKSTTEKDKITSHVSEGDDCINGTEIETCENPTAIAKPPSTRTVTDMEQRSLTLNEMPGAKLMKITTVIPIVIKPVPKREMFMYRLQDTVEWVPATTEMRAILQAERRGPEAKHNLGHERRAAERFRNGEIRKALDRLWRKIPSLTNKERFRKPNNLEILRGAMDYIKELRRQLGLPEFNESLLKGRFGFDGSLWRSHLVQNDRFAHGRRVDAIATGRSRNSHVTSNADDLHGDSTDILQLAMMRSLGANGSSDESNSDDEK